MHYMQSICVRRVIVNSEHYHHTIFKWICEPGFLFTLHPFIHSTVVVIFFVPYQSHLFVQVYFTVTAERFLTLSNQPQPFVRQEHESGEILMGQPHIHHAQNNGGIVKYTLTHIYTGNAHMLTHINKTKNEGVRGEKRRRKKQVLN